MKLLLLGGTVFLGRHLVEAALTRGHELTLFNRGQHSPGLYPDIEKLCGDRDGDLWALQGRRWDAVIDTCGFVPRIVKASAELLAGAVGHYTFISSISVYKDFSVAGIDESAPVGTLLNETVEVRTDETYGPLKALCEQTAQLAMPGRVLNVRPGLIVGPYDPTNRFTYWPRRVAQGGDVLAPGFPQQSVQFIDVRDLAEWLVRMVEASQTGTYNATGPDKVLTMERMLEECRSVSGSDANFVWVSEEFLIGSGVAPWTEIPLWIPQTENESGFLQVNSNKAMVAGLSFRPLLDTIRDTLAWDFTRPLDLERYAGLAQEREIELLQAWQGRTTTKL